MSSVVGAIWVKEYINLLDKHQKNKAKNIEDLGKRFKFGSSQHLKTKATIKISVKLLEKQYSVIIDVVESTIPLLMSRRAMAKVEMTIDLALNRVTIGGENQTCKKLRACEHCSW